MKFSDQSQNQAQLVKAVMDNLDQDFKYFWEYW